MGGEWRKEKRRRQEERKKRNKGKGRGEDGKLDVGINNGGEEVDKKKSRRRDTER